MPGSSSPPPQSAPLPRPCRHPHPCLAFPPEGNRGQLQSNWIMDSMCFELVSNCSNNAYPQSTQHQNSQLAASDLPSGQHVGPSPAEWRTVEVRHPTIPGWRSAYSLRPCCRLVPNYPRIRSSPNQAPYFFATTRNIKVLSWLQGAILACPARHFSRAPIGLKTANADTKFRS